MMRAMNEADWRQSLLAAMLQGAKRHGWKRAIAGDITTPSLNYRELFTRAFVLKYKIRPLLKDDKYVGQLLPNVLGAVVTFTSLQMLNKIPCMLNYSAGEAAVLHACRIAGVKKILTSKLFIEKGNLQELAQALEKEFTVIYLEDFRKSITLKDKLKGLLEAHFAHIGLSKVLAAQKPDDPAAVLYTSGSEGMPKGVALSHSNILVNIAQAGARIGFYPDDVVFNALPVFHSFGMTVGMIMPLICGIKSFLYPSPLHYKQIPKEVKKQAATIMLGTDTFYNGYSHYAEADDFKKVRLAVAGAEKLREKTRLEWQERFGVAIMQGYGVTETSPAIAINTPEMNRPGTVGVPFPLIECRLEKVEGIEKGGRLWIKGPNVMLGYLKQDNPGVINREAGIKDDWYDTGDIAEIDAAGFLSIVGRAKRFAKIGGEMVSLLAVEELALTVSPDAAHAAIAVPDERKGEQVLLYSEDKELSRDRLIAAAKEKGAAEIYLPRQVIFMEAIPRLGNGKINYPGLTALRAKA